MKSHFELMQMDTDSLYIAIAGDSIDKCVKPKKNGRMVRNKKEVVSIRRANFD